MGENILRKIIVCNVNFALIISCFLFQTVLSHAQNNRLWATYYGGSANESNGTIATDANGNVYMCGYTDSDSGIAYNGFQMNYASSQPNNNAFLVKFDSSGHRLWATYYGGPANTIGFGVALDASGRNVYLAGYTNSVSAIATLGSFQINFAGGMADAFLVKFDSSGNRLWATYYGGTGDEESGFFGCVATDANGNVYLQGFTNSDSGIASSGFQNTFGGGGTGDAFLVKFDSSGNRLWATYYGGPDDEWGYGMHVDAFGNTYVTGRTNSTSGIASGGFQSTFGGSFDAFLVKFDPNGNRLWATYYGGPDNEEGRCIASDATGNVYLTGYTNSPSGIASGGFQNVFGGVVDAFLVKFDPNGNRLWATYYGGTQSDVGNSIAVNSAGNVYLVGESYSSTGIADNGYQNNLMGNENAYVAAFDSNGNRLCATYYGQGLIPHDDEDGRVAVDGFGHVYLMGRTGSPTGIASGGFQDTIGCCIGPEDDYLVKFSTCGTLALPVASFESSDTMFCTNDCINYIDLSANATAWLWSFPGGIPSSSTNQNPQGICYNSQGHYDVKLIASNSGGSDTLTSVDFISVVLSPPTPVIVKSNDTLFCSTDTSYTAYQWYNDSSLILGATDTILVVSQNGNYNVSVKNENGCSIAVGINVVLGIESLLQVSSLQITVSPNPTENDLEIIIGKVPIAGERVNIGIYNMLGDKIFSDQFMYQNTKIKTDIDVSSFAKGVYLIQLSTEDKVIYRTKAVKE